MHSFWDTWHKVKDYVTLLSLLKGKFTQKNMLISDVKSDKMGKNAVVVLKIFAFKVKKLVIWRPQSWYANEGDMTSQLQDWKLRNIILFIISSEIFNEIPRNFIGC